MLRVAMPSLLPAHNLRALRVFAFASGVALGLMATVAFAGEAAPDKPTPDIAASGGEEDCLGPVEPAAIAEVVDARTLLLADGRVVRLVGVEPASVIGGEDGALLERMRALTASPEVALRLLGQPDRYGRLPALVVPTTATAGGRTLQAILLAEGLAVAATTESALSCFAQFLAAEQAARDRRAGVWASAAVLSAADPDLLTPWIGRFAIVEGVVRSVGNRRATTYLNFGFRWSTDFTVEILADAREAFGGEDALAALEGQRVRVRGMLEERGGPLLRLGSPLMLEGGPHPPGKAPVTPQSVAPAP